MHRAARVSSRPGVATRVEGTGSGNVIPVLTVPTRQLGESERAAVERILDRDPYAGAQIAERVAAHGLNWWRSDGRIFGYGTGRRIEPLRSCGAPLGPGCTTP